MKLGPVTLFKCRGVYVPECSYASGRKCSDYKIAVDGIRNLICGSDEDLGMIMMTLQVTYEVIPS